MFSSVCCLYSSLGLVVCQEYSPLEFSNARHLGHQGLLMKGCPWWGLHISAGFSKATGECSGCGMLISSWRQQQSVLPVCMLACLQVGERHDSSCSSSLVGMGKCHNFLCSQTLPRENSAITLTCVPQQVQWLLVPSQPVKVVGGCSVQACTPASR